MIHRPQIAFFGSSLVSAYWNGAATYYRGIIRMLHELGYQVTFYEPDAYDRQANRDIADPPWARVEVYTPTETALEECLQEAASAEFVIKASGVGVFDDLLEHELLERRESDQIVLFWDVDAPATLERVSRTAGDAFRKLIPQYDCILTYGGGDPVCEAYRALGARRCIPIFNAFDPDSHFPVPPGGRYACDLAFLGNRLPDREQRVQEFFLQVAERAPEKRFILGGSGWQSKRLPSNVSYLGHVPTRDHNRFNCSALAVLNISRDSMAAYGFSPATRVFEAAGSGACIITDAWKGIECFLEPDEEILVAHSGADVGRYLAELTPERARQVGEAARRRVLAEHTYEHRATELIQVFARVQANPLTA